MTLQSLEDPSETAAAIPSMTELGTAADAIAESARKAGPAIEQARRVPKEIVEQIRSAGLYRLLQPRAFGGYEAGFPVYVDLASRIARGDGSVGWIFSISAVHQWLIGLFPEEAQHDVWNKDRDAFAAGSYAPAGRAAAVDGGYRLSGAWSFASGCDTSSWLLLGSIFPRKGGEAAPSLGFFLVPKSQYRIDADTWHVAGLAGTGSKTIHLDDVFIPAHRVLTFAQGNSGAAPGTASNHNSLYRIPFMACVPSCLVAPTIGMAEGALELYIDTTRGRSTRGAVAGGNKRMAEFAAVQSRVAEAVANVDAAKTVLLRDLEQTQAMVAGGETISIDIRLRNRRTHAFSVKLAVHAVDALFYASGGNALALESPLQRFWRDVHAAGLHISTNWDAVSTMYGQHALGLEPMGQY